MGLKRFDYKLPGQNKNFKQIAMVLCICFIAVLSFTSYALYEVRHPNDLVNSKVGEFSTSDVSLAILVDGVKQKEFPSKGTGKVFDSLSCTNGGNASWSAFNWKLSINDINGPTECTINFKTGAEPEAPELNNGLIPVTYDGTNWVKADTTKEWYNYYDQWWANAVTVSASSRATYTSAAVNTPISMDDIDTMWVWIPRYEYQYSNLGDQYAGGTKALPGAISINFISKDTTTPSSDNFTIHDAFWWDDNNNGIKDTGEQLSGIWVAKFEMSTGATTCLVSSSSSIGSGCNLSTIKPYIKPNVTSWRGAQIGTFWTAIHNNMNGSSNQYGLTNTDAHLMKNMEWGAVAYLSQSKYGKYGNSDYKDANKEIYQNKSSSYTTGMSNGTPSSSTINTQRTYNIETSGTGASTTGNIYGIYDMSGGASEYVMGVMKASGSNEPSVAYPYGGTSGWSGKQTDGTMRTGDYGRLGDDPSTPDIIEGIGSKYYDLYNYGTSSSDLIRYHKGDATYEVTEWYLDYVQFVDSWHPFSGRGDHYSNSTSAGIFSSSTEYGGASQYYSGRPTLVSLN